MGLVYIFFTCWLFISIYIDAGHCGDVSHGKGLGGDLVNWILATSGNFTQTFCSRWIVTDSRFFWRLVGDVIGGLFCDYFFLARSAFHQESRAKTDRSVILSAFMLLLLLTFVRSRVGRFPRLVLWIYQLPFFSGFRSPEKSFLFFHLSMSSSFAGSWE